MDARVVEGDLATWAASLTPGRARQYQPIAQRLVRRFGEGTATAPPEALQAWIASLSGEQYQRKAVAAVRSFYAYLVDEGRVRPDPTRGLSKAVHGRRGEAELEQAVLEACGARTLEALRWSDVAALLIGLNDPAGIARLPLAHRNTLLGRVRSIIADGDVTEVAARCDLRVFVIAKPSP
jgi:hypothetical protein